MFSLLYTLFKITPIYLSKKAIKPIMNTKDLIKHYKHVRKLFHVFIYYQCPTLTYLEHVKKKASRPNSVFELQY